MTTAAAVYGSGSSMSNPYNDCIQQCQAKFGMGGGAAAPPPSKTGESGKKVHTVRVFPCRSVGVVRGADRWPPFAILQVIVAPTQGVLKFVPFAIE